MSIRSYNLITDDGFRCSSKHCRLENYKNDTHYGYYNSNDECNACKNICRNDVWCGGVECGKDRGCKWWKAGNCGTLEKQLRDDPSYRTCMKYDEGEDKDLKRYAYVEILYNEIVMIKMLFQYLLLRSISQ